MEDRMHGDYERRHLTIDIPAAGAILCGASRGTAYQLAKEGDLQIIQAGRRKVVPVVWLESKLMVGPGGLDVAIDRYLSENA